MMRLLFLLAALFLLSSVSHADDACKDFTGYKKAGCEELYNESEMIPADAFLGFVELGEELDFAGFQLYKRGLVDAVQATNAYLMLHKRQRLYCAPDDFKLGKHIEEIVSNAIKDDPSVGAEPVQFIIILELEARFPC